MTCEICSSDGAIEAMLAALIAAMSVFGEDVDVMLWVWARPRFGTSGWTCLVCQVAWCLLQWGLVIRVVAATAAVCGQCVPQKWKSQWPSAVALAGGDGLRTCQTIPEGALEQSASTCVSRLRNPLTWAHPTLTWMPERGRPLHRISHVGFQANNDMCNHETMSKQRGRQVECWLCPCFPFYIVKLLPSTVHNVTSISSSVRAAGLWKMTQNGEHVFGGVLVFKNT